VKSNEEPFLKETFGASLASEPSLPFQGRGERRPLFEPGTRLQEGRYRIEEVLGSGGEGVVYRAWDAETEHSIALKTLHLENRVSLPALKREFRMLRDLTHPSLVQLRELVVDAEHSFFTMDYVDGVDLLSAIDKGHDLRDLFLQLTRVLEFLHRLGRVHRDVKPTNILVTPSGHLTLLDFGVATRSGQASGKVFAGTPHYLAPELSTGGTITPAADAYSVGVLLFEALTGTLPLLRRAGGRASEPPRPVARFDVEDELLDACQALLCSDPTKRADLGMLARSLGAPRTSSPVSIIRNTSSVGREAELAVLTGALARVNQSDEPQLVLVSGASGIGKSALLEQFILRVSDRATVLSGRCSEHELVPHKAVDGLIEWLRGFLLSLDPSEVPEFVTQSDARSLLLLFPELAFAPGFPDLEPRHGVPSSAPAARQSAYQALARVLRRISECELLVCIIDDMQWGDIDSARLLREVFCGGDSPACLLVVAYRSEARRNSECLRELFDGPLSLLDELRTETLELGPVSDEYARDIIASLDVERTLSPQIVTRLIQDCAGSPLLLTELTSHLLSSGDRSLERLEADTLSAVVRERYTSLSKEAQVAFDLLCCSSSPLRLKLLTLATGAPPTDLIKALTGARLAQLTAGEHSLEPLHDALREAHLSLIEKRAERHAELAELLVREDQDPAEIARHYFAARNLEAASRYAAIGAGLAARSGAHHRAAELYELALACGTLPPERRRDIEERLAYTLADCGRGAEAAPLLLRLASDVEGEKALALRRAAAEQMLITGATEEGTKLLAEVQRQVGLRWPKSPGNAVLQIMKERVGVFWRADRPFEPKGLTPRQSETLSACRAAWAISYVSPVHGAANSARYLRLALDYGHPRHAAHAYAMEAQYRAIVGPRAEPIVSRHMERAEQLLGPPKDGYDRAFIPYCLGQISYLFGDFRRSNQYYEEAEPLMIEYGSAPWELTSLRIFWANNLHNLGRARELKRRVDAWLKDSLARGDLFLTTALQYWRAHLVSLRENDAEKALAIIDEAALRWRAPYMGVHHFLGLFARIYTHLQAGQPEDALLVLDQMEKDMKSSHMYSIQVPRVWFRNYEVTAALAAAARAKPSLKRALLRRAKRAAEHLAREQVLYSDALAIRGLALVELMRKPGSEGAIEMLRGSLAMSDACDMVAYSAGTMLRLGLEIGGSEGAEYLARAERAYHTVEAKDFRAAARASCALPE
jgi:serine/threonine protein kinase